MGKYNKGILGAFSGKVETVIRSSWKTSAGKRKFSLVASRITPGGGLSKISYNTRFATWGRKVLRLHSSGRVPGYSLVVVLNDSLKSASAFRENGR